MIITKEITIAMGHSVTNHNSKCRGLHGHDYRIIATVDGDTIKTPGYSSEGMVVDFGDLKQAMMDVIDRYYDHGFVIYEKDPRAPLLKVANEMWSYQEERLHLVSFIPTAENLAAHWFKLLESHLELKYHIKLQSLQVYETPTSSAIYSRPIITSSKLSSTNLTIDGDVVVHGGLTVDEGINTPQVIGTGWVK